MNPSAQVEIQVPQAPAQFLYGTAILLSSFLLFVIEPLFARMILPWFGGSASVWSCCLVFFQAALLAGYGYAHALSRLAARAQALIHTALLVVAVVLLPIVPAPWWRPAGGESPTLKIMLLLAGVIGLPFFLLSATTPLMQTWYARQWPAEHAYRLFALSNFSSLAALICFPVWIERHLSTREQAFGWSYLFAGFAVLAVLIAWNASGVPAAPGARPRAGQASTPADVSGWGDRVLWILLSAIGSMLLLSTTNQLTQNVAPVPFLWVMPLALYLLTFVLCFESERWYRPALIQKLMAVAVASVGYAIYDIQVSEALIVSIPIFCFGLFAGCMFCHGELARRRPEQDRLTSFYLSIALGGAAGAVMVGLVAPTFLTGVYELPITLVALSAMALWLQWRDAGPRLIWAAITAAMGAVLAVQVGAYHRDAIVLNRSFYGALRVVERIENGSPYRALFHGTVKHGQQFLSEDRSWVPTTYYSEQSGVAAALRAYGDTPRRVGVIGLGVGTVAAYGRTGDLFRFYEIDPEVVQIAQHQFQFLSHSPAAVQVVLGDARLSLEGEKPQNFDVLIADAFSGDAIPVHLLTREAFAVYFRHLHPGGMLAIHISNQYLDLAPMVRKLANGSGAGAVILHNDADSSRGIAAADWMLISRDASRLRRVQASPVPLPQPAAVAWTDDRNNLLEVLRPVPLHN